MLRSMTGFGCAQALIEGVAYAIEVRSVNGRYFRSSIRLPDTWSHAEMAMEKVLRERLARGSVNLVLRMRVRDEAAAHGVNAAALQRYAEQARAALGDGARLDMGSMLLLPGVCEPPETDELCEASRPALMAALNQAVDAVVEMRQREGEALGADLLAHCGGIEEHLKGVEARKDTVVADFQQRLVNRVNELVNAARLTVSEQDLVREVAVFAERSDISEEIARLRSHLEQFRRAVDEDEQPGRKLDFITQEMLREANTIASKANDAEIARSIVEVKSAIDRIKEQVQNAE